MPALGAGVLGAGLALAFAAHPGRAQDATPALLRPVSEPERVDLERVSADVTPLVAAPVKTPMAAAPAAEPVVAALAPASPVLPAAASAYASADSEAIPLPRPVPASPTPDAAVSPLVAVPPVPDLGRPLADVPGLDGAAVRQAIELYRRGNVAEADKLTFALPDEGARALLEWVAIRFGAPLGFERIVAFSRANPDWPTGPLVRRRAEEALLSERKSATVVRAFFARERPSSPSGKLALALALQRDGLAVDAATIVRDLWRDDSFGREFESRVLDAFPGIVGELDHRYRMERQLGKENWEVAARAAAYAGKAYGTLVRARRAIDAKASNAAAILDAVPPSLRGDSSYLLSRASLLRRAEKPAEAARVMALAPRNPEVIASPEAWWIERRILARKLLDGGDAKAAYMVAMSHSAASGERRIEAEFHSGWIALRFLGDAAAAAGHFAEAARIAETPISIARAAYWQGRAAEALGEPEAARAYLARAAAQPVAYYGQLARAKLGSPDLALRPPAPVEGEARAAIERRLPFRSARLAAALAPRDIALALYVDLAARLGSAAELGVLGDLALAGRDPRALVAVGKGALQRGFALDLHAYPTIGIPAFEASSAVLPVEQAMVFAIARQESQFDPKAQSGAGARGLMQLMPATARRTAQRIGLAYDEDKLTGEPAYNAKIGTAHLGELMADWKGSYILAFASYNAGGGNVKKWIDAYGDPRAPGVDPVDWVERIPFSETRNYVQRVMENVQVYRHRLDGRSALLIEGDLRRGAR